MEETINTGVIYKITNTITNKIYIGKAFSYEKHGKRPLSKYGSLGRFRRHCSNAMNNNDDECPLLYKAIREYGKECWNIETLEICNKQDLKIKENEYILREQSYLIEKGYNIMIGDKNKYEKQKVKSNKKRANNSAMKRTDKSKNLPANIYYRKSKINNSKEIEGYFVQIKINGKLYNKAFMSSKITMEQKLELAKQFLENIKKSE